ncbi:MAG: DUF4282 domain-containing protein [Pseudomonadota bacterium]
MEKLIETLIFFEKPLGEKVVRYAYYLGVAVITFWALVVLFGVLSQGFFAFVGALILSPLLFGAALFFWRVVCEALLALFRIQGYLAEMAEREKAEPATPAADHEA